MNPATADVLTALPKNAVVALRGRVVVVIDTESEAYDIALAFGPKDRFRSDVERAAAKAWPRT